MSSLIKYLEERVIEYYINRERKLSSGARQWFVDDYGNDLVSPTKNKKYSYKIVGKESSKVLEILKSLSSINPQSEMKQIHIALNNLGRILFHKGYISLSPSKQKESYLNDKELTLVNLFFIYIQISIYTSNDTYEKRLKIKLLRRDQIFMIYLFKNISERIRYRLTLYLLGFSDVITPSFFKFDYQNPHKSFTVKEFTRMKQIFIAKVTKPFPWTHRFQLSDRVTELYFINKTLLHKSKKAEIRVFLIEQLNNYLSFYNIDGKIVEENVPTKEQILNTRDEILKGKLPMSTANKFF